MYFNNTNLKYSSKRLKAFEVQARHTHAKEGETTKRTIYVGENKEQEYVHLQSHDIFTPS